MFDHELTDAEKRAYLRSNPKSLPFANRLMVPDSDYIVLGYNTFDPAEPPVGDDETNFRAWNAALLAQFIATKDIPFASMAPNRKFTVSKFKIDDDGFKRHYEKNAKNFKPTVCGTGDHGKESMLAFAKQVDVKGVGIPPSVTTLANICVYNELLVREQAMNPNPKCLWLTPEELSVLYDSKENEAAFRKEFKQ